ncbi:hypothetical protein Hanom_Chr08g00698131 [Helianthus anomalus]
MIMRTISICLYERFIFHKCPTLQPSSVTYIIHIERMLIVIGHSNCNPRCSYMMIKCAAAIQMVHEPLWVTAEPVAAYVRPNVV